MDRAKEWNVELINRFPLIDIDGVSATVKFITILEEMGGFDNGADLKYNILTHDVQVQLGPDCNCIVYPTYGKKQIQLRCVLYLQSYPFSIIDIQPTSEAIQVFLRTYWSELFPKEST